MSRINTSIRTQNRAVVASLSIPGTNLDLEYDSTRALGNVGGRRLVIPVSGDSIPDSLKHIEVTISVAGRTFEATYPPETNVTHTFRWDGRNADGEPMAGATLGTVDIAYVYDGQYPDPAAVEQLIDDIEQSFGVRPSRSAVLDAISRQEIKRQNQSTVWLYGRPTTALAFGGWKPNLLKAPDQFRETTRGTLASARTNVLEVLVNTFGWVVDGHTDDGVDFNGIDIDRQAFGPDGALYAVGDRHAVWKVDRSFWENYGGPDAEENAAPRSAVTRIAGTDDYGYSVDGGPAREAKFNDLKAMAVGPDGAVYTASHTNRVIRRIDPDGVVRTVAGTAHTLAESREEPGSRIVQPPTPNADLGRATETDLYPILDMAVGPDGSLYFAERAWWPNYGGTVRRLTPSGRIVPVAGTVEDWAMTDDGIPQVEGEATDLLFRPIAIDVDSEGTVYVVSVIGKGYPQVVRAVHPSGEVRTFLGEFSKYDPYRGDPERIQEDGDPTQPPLTAAETRYDYIHDISVGPDDTLYVADDGGRVGGDVGYSRGSVTAIEPDGSVRVLAGGGGGENPTWFPDPGESALGSFSVENLMAGPDNELYFADPYHLARIGGQTGQGNTVPSADGGLAFETDGDGRHEGTQSPLLGTTRWTNEFDDDGRVGAFVDAYDNRTTVERDDDGNLAAVEAPTGQRTTFETDANGHLSAVTFPDGRTVGLDMTHDGLVERIEDPAGNVTQFAYDDGGVTRRTDPTGAVTDLTTEIDREEDVYRVTRVSPGPAFRESTHEVDRTHQTETFTSTCCGGRTTSTSIVGSEADTWKVSREDGGTRELSQGVDPRFGGLAPVTETAREVSPGGREVTTETSRSAESDGPDSVDSFTETLDLTAGETTHSFELSYDGDDAVTVTTPEGRVTEFRFDENGFRAGVAPAGVAPTSVTRDDRGRIEAITQGGASTTVEYDDDGHFASVTDASGATVEYDRDEAGRLTTLTRPTGAQEAFAYDANSNLTRFTRPNGDGHAFSYTARDRVETYTPPEGGTEEVTYDGDGLPTERTLPSGRTITNTFGQGRELQAAEHPDASVTYTRDDAGRATELVRSSRGEGADQTVSTVRDGRVIEELSYDGAVSGTFEYDHDAFGRTAGVTYPDGTSRSFAHDADGLLTEAGAFSVTREGPDGAVTEMTDGTLTISRSYDDRGNVSTRTHSIDGTTVYEVELVFDDAGLLVERTETVDGTTHTETFTYDAAGRLTGVDRDGTAVERYEYDANGNRTEKTVDGETETATYRTGDRLDERGETAYDHDDDGFLTERGDVAFTYSAVGELLEAAPEMGSPVTYDYDGHGRRVARTRRGETTEYLYGDPTDPWQLSVVRETTGETTVRTQYYYDPDGRLVGLDRDGDRYYVATDQVGTPRVVVAEDGSVAKTVDRTAFGEVRSDSAPEFALHVGFAGGLVDPTTDTVRFGHRDYEPAAGRFTARDPLRLAGGQYNFYAYGRNDPLSVTDPNGLSCYWQEVSEDATNAIDYAAPLKNVLSVAQAGLKTAQKSTSTVTDVVDDATESAAVSQGNKALPSSEGSFFAQAGSAIANSTVGATVGSVVSSVATGATATATAGAAATSAGTAAAVEGTFWAAAGAGSAVSNLPKLADSEYRSAGEWLGDQAFKAIHGESPYAFERAPPGSGGGCGEKSPENC